MPRGEVKRLSTYANIEIEGQGFHIRSDGWDGKTIRDCVREYVAEIKGKVKSEYLITAALNAITADAARDYYAPFSIGYVDLASYHWKVRIGPRGGVNIVKQSGALG
jgi:hypothetical protein